VRVTDSSTPPNPVLGANALFQSTIMRPTGNNLSPPGTGQNGTTIILGESQSTVQSDGNGLATIVPSVGSFTGPLLVQIQITAGATALLQEEVESFPAL
jgi:hypothetical protein